MCADVSNIPVVASTTPSNMKVKTAPKAGSEDAQASFLQLLVAQISNQTPDSTLDATQMITQFAQMNAALGLQKLSSSVNFQKLSTATTMIDQVVTVQYNDEDTNRLTSLTGLVTGVDYDTNGEPMILVNGKPYSLDSVRRVGT